MREEIVRRTETWRTERGYKFVAAEWNEPFAEWEATSQMCVVHRLVGEVRRAAMGNLTDDNGSISVFLPFSAMNGVNKCDDMGRSLKQMLNENLPRAELYFTDVYGKYMVRVEAEMAHV